MNQNIAHLLSQLTTPAAREKSTPTDTSLSSPSLQHMALIKQLIHEQSRVEISLLANRDLILNRILLLRNQIYAAEILGNDTSNLMTELIKLTEEERTYCKAIYDDLLHLRKKQQHLLATSKLPMFKVSDDPAEISEMMWVFYTLSQVLAPFLESIKAGR
jgi:hypothetical protein